MKTLNNDCHPQTEWKNMANQQLNNWPQIYALTIYTIYLQYTQKFNIIQKRENPVLVLFTVISVLQESPK